MGIEWGIELFGDVIKQIIKEFPLTDEERAKKPFKGDETAIFMRGKATNELKNVIENSYNLDDYVISFSPGQSQWNHRPWGGIRNKNITSSFQNGFYVVYLFSTDRKGVYLSLNQGYTNIERDSEIKDKIGELEQRSIFLRNNISKIPEDFSNLEVDCKDEKREKTQAGNIISKYYSIDDLDNEEMLVDDLNTIMEIYGQLIPIYEQKFIENSIRANFSERNGDIDTRIWKITPGEGPIRETLWDLFVNNNVIGIGWFGDKIDYLNFKTQEDVKKELSQFYNKSMDLSAKMIWDFVNSIKIGDIIVANSGYKGVLGIGMVESGYIGPNNQQNPAKNPIQQELFQDYVHFRKIKWLINDKITFSSQVFDQRTLSPINGDKWKKIKEAYIKKSQKYKELFDELELNEPNGDNIVCKPVNIIKMLYDEFENTFYNSEEGIEHSQKYDIERQKVREYYELVGNNPQAKDNVQDPPINHLLPIKEPSVAPASVGSITAYGYKNEDLPGLTEAVYNLLENLINTKNKDKQKELIKSFKSGQYANGFRSAMLSPVLYYLSPEFLLINQKTVDTFNFISEILEKEEKISVEMVDYIDNNQKLKNLLKNLSEYIPNLNFEKFDEFCHWMCYDKLGNYAKDNEKYNEWLLSNCPKDEGEETNENAFLKLLKNIYRHEMQIALGELERGKNVILYGPPGSGKTVLSKIISEEYLGKNAYSLYTVHSGTDYYDLVCRIVPQIDDKGNLVYSKEKRFLLDALLSGKVLILDEINRTQIDTALGIFFTYLERDHRINDVEQIKALLKKEIDEELDSNDLKGKLSDFRIIGTLNVYDKTFLFKLGDALKRRFTFVEITTRNDLIENLVSSEEFKKEFTNACDYNGDINIANTIIEAFADLNRIKPMGVGVLKDALQFSSYFGENAADLAISSLIIPFFENDLNYSNILSILERYGLNTSVTKLKSLNFGTSDMNGI